MRKQRPLQNREEENTAVVSATEPPILKTIISKGLEQARNRNKNLSIVEVWSLIYRGVNPRIPNLKMTRRCQFKSTTRAKIWAHRKWDPMEGREWFGFWGRGEPISSLLLVSSSPCLFLGLFWSSRDYSYFEFFSKMTHNP